MRTSRRPATPDYESDVITNGVICLYRNEAGRRFSREDQFILSEEWIDPEDLPDTYTRLEAAEHRLASKHSLAWHPDFGYLSPIPEHCGTGLQIYAEFHLEGLHLIVTCRPCSPAWKPCVWRQAESMPMACGTPDTFSA